MGTMIEPHSKCIDIKITNVCDQGCPFCHEGSFPDGIHGDINKKFFDTIHPYTEVTIDGGNPLSHPDLEKLLLKLRSKKVFANITVNAVHFLKEFDRCIDLYNRKLISGIGVSYNGQDLNMDILIKKLQSIPTAIVHVIEGIISVDILKKFAHNDIRINVLGFKPFRRDLSLYCNVRHREVVKKRNELIESLPEILEDKWFPTVTFDTLAINRLKPDRFLKQEERDSLYISEDGEFTFFIDLVDEQFSVNSSVTFGIPLFDNVDAMFKVVRDIREGMKNVVRILVDKMPAKNSSCPYMAFTNALTGDLKTCKINSDVCLYGNEGWKCPFFISVKDAEKENNNDV